MSEYNAYEAFHESLNATNVLSDEYKRTLSAILGKAMEQAAERGREQGHRVPLAARRLKEVREENQRLKNSLSAAKGIERELRQTIAAMERAVDERCVKIEAGVFELGRRLEEEKERSAGFYARARCAELRLERMRRDICVEAGCEREGRVQRCSQPLADCVVGP